MNMARSRRGLTGKQKAAILLISLGPDVSAQVYKHLSEEEIERLSLEISSVQKVDSDLKEEVLEQFHQIALAQDYISQGGVGYAKTVLDRKSTRLNSSHVAISYAVFCLKKKNKL